MRNLLDNQYVQSPATIFAKCNIFQRIFSYVGILSLLLNMQSNTIQAQSMDTLVCDNGGFEDDFQYYKGYFAIFDSLNTTACIPYYSGNAVSWGSIGQPLFRRFEITSNGLDTLTGIDRVRFGSKALLLNNRYGHNLSSDPCIPQSDVNMIRKRFKVTADNREFTIWYAVILENPSSPGHSTNRPFFSIACDRAPEYDLCFDSNILKCGELISDSLCVFDTIQYVNWTCHRIKIPKNMVDSIATLEIIASDCGANHHFGYAYIDGICEDCSGSALGAGQLYDIPYSSAGNGIKYRSCDGQTITICGSYSLPLECGTWAIDSLNISDFDVNQVEVDTANKQFCFDLPLSNFSEFTADSCREIFVKLYFSSNLGASIASLSNSIEICFGDYEPYIIVDTIGICQNNGTSNLLSDDYYYVKLIINVNEGDGWDIYRKMDDPYPNETGQYLVSSGTGFDSVDLGPFLIQDGSWELILDLGDCSDTLEITQPGFCSGCNLFRGTAISNVTCIPDAAPVSADPYDDTWSFEIRVPGDPSNYYYIGTSTTPYYYNSTYTITEAMSLECHTYSLKQPSNELNCHAEFIVCPPKPCSGECELEAYLRNVVCDEVEEEEVFYAYLNLSNGGSNYYCYESYAVSDPGNSGNDNYYSGNFSNPLGPFKNEDVYAIVYLCNGSECSCDPTCFKILYIPKPDCDNLAYRINGSTISNSETANNVVVIPNPVNNDEFVLKSTMQSTTFDLSSSSGKILYHGSFIGPQHTFSQQLPAGVYFISYKTSKGQIKHIQVVKQ